MSTKLKYIKLLEHILAQDLNLTYNEKTGRWDCEGNVNLSDYVLNRLPLTFGIISGHFWCYSNNLTTLKGSPIKALSFNCGGNKLTSLKGGPEIVTNFYCYHNQLTSLEFGPKIVLENYNCCDNPLTDLKGVPKEIGGRFICNDTKITDKPEWFTCKQFIKYY